VPDAACSTPAGDEAEAAWFARLSTVVATAAALFINPAGRVLLVKPNYRDHWSLAGGILEHGEPPHVGCRREVSEEIGLDIEPGPLLVVAWMAPGGVRTKPVLHFIFDGGVLADDSPIRLQSAELEDYRFVDADDLDRYLPTFIRAQVAAALRARGTGVTVYLQWTEAWPSERIARGDADAQRQERDRDDLEVGQAERDADDRQAQRDAADQVSERELPAEEKDPDDVADNRADPGVAAHLDLTPERP
jgi:8-oxo-dGTP diphosphatase